MADSNDRTEADGPARNHAVLWMLVGTVLVGLSGYAFLAVIGHGRFDAATAAALAATYLLSNIFGPGVFIAAEQEASRVISDQSSRGGVDRGTIHRLALICAGLCLATVAVLGLCAPSLLAKVLDGQVGLILALLLAVVGSAAVYYLRGLAGGRQRFHRYAATTGIDGAARIAGCLALAAAGSTNPVAYAFALCAGPAVAAVCTARGITRSVGEAGGAGPNGPGSSTATLATGVAYLLVASVVSTAMANLAPVIVTGMLDDPGTAAGFAAAVVLTRVPLLLIGPIQALILPRLTTAAAQHRFADFRRETGIGLAIIGGLAVAAVATVALLGHWAIRVLVGPAGDTTSTTVLILITVSAMLQMAVQFLQPALVAVRRHRALVLAWLTGAVAFGLAFLLPLAPIDRGVLAQLGAPIATLIVQLIALAAAVGRARTTGRPGPGPAVARRDKNLP